LNFDYSLFILSRFKEVCDTSPELESTQERVKTAVLEMLRRIAPVVICSGGTLATVFSGLLFLHSSNLAMAGLGCVITVVVCMAATLTAVPGALLSAPVFFGSSWNAAMPHHMELPTADDTEQPENVASRMLKFLHQARSFRNPSRLADVRHRRVWHELSAGASASLRQSNAAAAIRGLTVWPCNFIVVLMLQLVAAAAGWQAMRLELSSDISQLAPRSGLAFNTQQELVRCAPAPKTRRGAAAWGSFSGFAGIGAEFRVVIEATGTNSFEELSSCGYALTAAIAQAFMNLPSEDLGFVLPQGAIFAMGWAQGTPMTAQLIQEWQQDHTKAAMDSDVAMVYYADVVRLCRGFCVRQLVPHGPAATFVSVTLPVLPSSIAGGRFIQRSRTLLKDFSTSSPDICNRQHVNFFLADVEGAAVTSYDMMVLTFSEFRRVLVVSCILVFLMISIFLRSVFVPLRLALTLVLPLCSVFGTAVLVYQDNWLGWLGWKNIAASGDGSFQWEIPIFCFVLTAALALDYDLLVVLRIRDFRFEGYTSKASIVRAMHETRWVVVSAGVMMAIAFGGNLLAESTALNQAGWILSSGVLVDVFVVRTFMVPALLSLADKVAWWPSIPPSENLCDEFGIAISMSGSNGSD